MMLRLYNRQCLGLAGQAIALLISLRQTTVLAQDQPENGGADKHRLSAAGLSELPDPDFSPHGPYLGPLEIAHIARFGNLPRRMFLEPHLIPPVSIGTLEPGYVPLFDRTLREMSDPELLESAALSLARVARENLQEISGSNDILLKHLESHSHLRVRFACARALVNADVSQSGAALVSLDEYADDSQRLWIDPALARWKVAAATDGWKQRLAGDAETTMSVSLACDGLAALGDPQPLDLLQSVLQDEQLAYEKRRAAAKAICVLAPDRAFADADSFTSGDTLERLLGIELLSSSEPEAHTRLLTLCADKADGVAAAAWTALFRLNPDGLISALPAGRRHNDALIRMAAARVMRLFPDVERAGWLNEQLSDRHLEVRNVAREMLFLVAQEQTSLQDQITTMAGDVLAENNKNWQGIEQSLLLLGQLRASQFSDRCIPLLAHPRNEVLVTAAWLLHLFPDPAVEAAVRKHLMRNEEMFQNAAPAPDGADIGQQSSYLIQYAGLMRLKDLQAVLEPDFNKLAPGGNFKRAASLWALGLFHERDPVPELAKSFLGRLADRYATPPELDEVRRSAAIALGFIRAESAVPGLLEAYNVDNVNSAIPDSARWSLGMIGEPLLEPVKAYPQSIGGWKLSPSVD